MALHWTYSADFYNSTVSPYPIPSNPAVTIGIREQVRFLIQDTRPARQLIFDEEIDFVQSQEANVYMMAARCIEVFIIKNLGQNKKKVGDLELGFDLKFYKGLAADLRARGMTYQVPYVGGISIADKLAQEADPDWVAPRIGMTTFDNPQAEQPATQTDVNTPGFPHN